ncbi:MAG TPA: DUF3048 domain-containing protein [Aggregatilineales bacterium]|nr:DUF3048 domain-containing protein [Aggregatilineales bacterium]
MRRGIVVSIGLITIVIFILILSIGTGFAQDDTAPTIPATNTPRNFTPDTDTPTASPTETSMPSDTPSPTQTSTSTLSPTATDTSTPSATPTESETPTPSITPTTIGPVNFPDNYNSLNGLPFPDEAAANRRNLIVKISNFPEVVRPQYGLNAADLVYEYEAEGGVTRFAAFYRNNAPEMVGSVRSARLIDIELVTAYNAMLGYSGSNEWIRQYILQSDWRWRALSPQIGNNCPMFCRIRWDNRPFEHTLFANTLAIWQEADRIQVNQPMKAVGLAFDEQPDPGGERASDIAIDWFSDRAEVRWQYRPEDNKYYRFDSGLPHIDAATGEPITADNIVLIEVWHVDRPDVYESEIGGIALEHQLWGTGTAWVFRDGMWYRGEWFRNRDRGGVYLRYLDENKTPIHLRPGKTFIEVVRKLYIGSENDLWSVTVSPEYVDAQATAIVQSERLTAVPAATQTQFAEWYGSPTPSQTWTPTPTGTWQH